MFRLSRLVLIVVLAATFGVMFGQITPRQTTVCEIAKDPQQFQAKLVTVRDRVRIAFEDFELSTTGCSGPVIDGVWLEYGKGPRRQPAIWCCGDLTPRDPEQRFSQVPSFPDGKERSQISSHRNAHRPDRCCGSGTLCGREPLLLWARIWPLRNVLCQVSDPVRVGCRCVFPLTGKA
jgi:hypothetical protein